MGRTYEQWQKERDENPAAARHEHIIPPEDVSGVRTRTGRHLEAEFSDITRDEEHNKVNATLDALDAYWRTNLSFSAGRPNVTDEFYKGVQEHLTAVQDALKDAQKAAKDQAKDDEKAAADEPAERPVVGGKTVAPEKK